MKPAPNVLKRTGDILFMLSLLASAAYVLAELSQAHWAVLVLTPALIGAFLLAASRQKAARDEATSQDPIVTGSVPGAGPGSAS